MMDDLTSEGFPWRIVASFRETDAILFRYFVIMMNWEKPSNIFFLFSSFFFFFNDRYFDTKRYSFVFLASFLNFDIETAAG